MGGRDGVVLMDYIEANGNRRGGGRVCRAGKSFDSSRYF